MRRGFGVSIVVGLCLPLVVTAGGLSAGTVDGQYEGLAVAGTKIQAGGLAGFAVAGRAGVPADAEALVLTVTVTEPESAGYLTVFDCSTRRAGLDWEHPGTSTINFGPGESVPNLVVVPVTDRLCVYTSATAHALADVSGYFAAGSQVAPLLVPARLLDTRMSPVGDTVDGEFEGIGTRRAGEVTEVRIAGRGGIGEDASAAVLNVAVTGSEEPGYVTAHACDLDPPNASNLNHAAGQTIAGLVMVPLGPDGTVCVVTSANAELIVDAVAEMPDGVLSAISPVRLLDTRPGSVANTVDGDFVGGGRRIAGSTTALRVAGRGGVPADADAVVLTVASTESEAPGFVTVFECGRGRPLASNVNHAAGESIANAVIAPLDDDGDVCLYTLSAGHLVVDATGWFDAASGFVTVEPARVFDSRTVTPAWNLRSVGALFDEATTSPFDIDCAAVGVCALAVADDVDAGAHPGAAVTSDGGASWRAREMASENDELRELDCPGIDTCYFGGAFYDGNGAAMAITRNGGRTWRTAALVPDGWVGDETRRIVDVTCASEDDCVVLLELESLLGSPEVVAAGTTDGGRTWQQLGDDPLPVSEVPESIDCPTAGFCIVIVPGRVDADGMSPRGGHVLRTTDRGETWVDVMPRPDLYLEDADCVSDTVCYLSGQTSKRRYWWITRDGGDEWHGWSGVPVDRVDDLSCSTFGGCHAIGALRSGEDYRVVRRIEGSSPTWTTRYRGPDELLAITCPTMQFCAVATRAAGTVLVGDPP